MKLIQTYFYTLKKIKQQGNQTDPMQTGKLILT